jgi:hypothetical protein
MSKWIKVQHEINFHRSSRKPFKQKPWHRFHGSTAPSPRTSPSLWGPHWAAGSYTHEQTLIYIQDVSSCSSPDFSPLPIPVSWPKPKSVSQTIPDPARSYLSEGLSDRQSDSNLILPSSLALQVWRGGAWSVGCPGVSETLLFLGLLLCTAGLEQHHYGNHLTGP